MMTTTHGLIGLLTAIPMVFVSPELSFFALLGGMIGGVFPDFDLFFEHRKTLHFPFCYAIAAAVLSGVFVVYTSPLTAALFFFAIAASLHSLLDMVSCGLASNKKMEIGDSSIYNHVKGKWSSSHTVIRYDGSPEDVSVSIFTGIPSIILLEGMYEQAAIFFLTISIIYFVFRRRFHNFSLRLID